MKKTLILLMVLSTTNIFGQDHVLSPASNMEKLSALIGHWEGEGWMQQGNSRHNFRQTEHVQTKLNGTTLLIEGNGFTGDSLAFQAMAIASYDVQSEQYRFNSFLADGKYTEASGKFTEEGDFVWQFEVPNSGIVKYEIIFTTKTWQEKGYYSSDGGSQWYNFLEMNLTKTKK